MKRRNLLAGIPLVAAGFSGCLSGRTNDQNDSENTGERIDYEECPLEIVKVRHLPSAARDEVKAAIEEGVYKTVGELNLAKVVDIDQKYLESDVDEETIYYEATVETGYDSTRLFVEKIVPEFRGEGIELENLSEKDLTADIRIEYEGELFLEESIDIRAGDEIEVEGDNEFLYGEYFAEVSVPNEEKLPKTDHTWEVDENYRHPSIRLILGDRFREGIHFLDHNEHIYSGYCSWNDDGGLGPTWKR
jgi:hypothetical protein